MHALFDNLQMECVKYCSFAFSVIAIFLLVSIKDVFQKQASVHNDVLRFYVHVED